VTTLYATATQQPACSTPVKTFICPTRRDASAGAVTDYAGAYHGGINANSLAAGRINGKPSCPEAANNSGGGLNGILDTYTLGPGAIGVPITTVVNGAGTSNTIIMAHKILQPIHYSPGGQVKQDRGWAWSTWVNGKIGGVGGAAYDHMRWADSGAGGPNQRGTGYFPDRPGVDENHFGGPHPAASPVLWADGAVRNYSYGYTDGSVIAQATYPSGTSAENAVFQALLAYNRSEVVTGP
jgi:hypothetical protein